MSLLFVRESEMMLGSLSNSTSMSEEASGSSVLNPMFPSQSPQQQQEEKIRKKRNLPGNPDPESEVVALSPKTLMATNRFVCEICNKGFQRDQNLQLHRRGHNLPWKLKQRNNKEYRKKVYVCPEPSCVHHNPSRALGDLTGIKKHFCRKHGEKKWRCEKCSKKYAVQSDYKAHMKTCGTREYKCDCGTVFSRKDSFITHRAFCDALAQESARLTSTTTNNNHPLPQTTQTDPPPFHLNTQNPSSSILSFSTHFPTQHHQQPPPLNSWNHPPQTQNPSSSSNTNVQMMIKPEFSPMGGTLSSSPLIKAAHNSNFPQYPNMNVTSNTNTTTAHMSATAMLQAANIGAAAIACGATPSQSVSHHMAPSSMTQLNGLGGLDGFESVRSTQMGGNNALPSQHYMGFNSENLTAWQENDRATRDFLGLAVGECGNDAGNVNVREFLSFTGALDFQTYDRDHSMLKPPAPGFGFC